MFKSLKNRTPLGLLQLKHNKIKMFTALAGIAFADILMFMQLGFKDALFTTNTQYSRLTNGDIVLLSTQATNFNQLDTFPRRRLYQSMDLPGVESAEPVYISSLIWRNPQTKGKTSMMVIGFDPERPAFNLPDVNRQLDKVKIPNAVLFDSVSRGDYEEVVAQVKEEQTLTTEIDRTTVSIAGLFELGASFADDGALITSDQNFLRLFPKKSQGTPSLGLIDLESGQDPVAIREALNMHLPEDVQAYTHEEYVEKEMAYIQNRTPIGFIFTLGTTMGFIVGIVIVYQVLSTDVNDHISEYATFKAMGYKNSYLLYVVLEEALILSFVGFVPSVGLAMGIYQVTAVATALPIFMPMSRAITVLIMTLAMCGISGAIATRKLQSADPADIF